MIRPVLTLALIGLVAAALLAGLNLATRDRIDLQQRAQALATLNRIVPPETYDNDLIDDRIRAWIAGLQPPSTLYRARKDEQPVAVLAEITTKQGYSGPITLLVGMRPNGRIIGVRVISHQETPGLGDRIEHRRGDWIGQFTGTTPDQPLAEAWKSRRRGGEFDALSSATVTSEAVIGAIRSLLDWYERNQELVFETRNASGTD